MLLFVDVMGESVLLYLSEQIIIFQSQGGSFYQSIRGESCQMLTNKRPRKMLPPIRSRKRRQLTNERTGQSEQTIISGQQRARTHGTRGHQHWRRSICWRTSTLEEVNMLARYKQNGESVLSINFRSQII